VIGAWLLALLWGLPAGLGSAQLFQAHAMQ